MIEPEAPGGQAGSSSRIENYLGFPSGLSGADLARRAYVQASRFKAEFLTQCVTGIRAENQYRLVRLGDGREVSCHVCLIAIGVNYRRLDAPGIDRLTGLGVYYGAALVEARSCKDEHVFIIGGANSAGQAAMHFSKYARPGNDAGARRIARKDDVEIFDRSDRSNIQYNSGDTGAGD